MRWCGLVQTLPFAGQVVRQTGELAKSTISSANSCRLYFDTKTTVRNEITENLSGNMLHYFNFNSNGDSFPKIVYDNRFNVPQISRICSARTMKDPYLTSTVSTEHAHAACL
jgi:hypothetical protein